RDAPHGCREPSLARVPAPGGRRGRRRLDRASHPCRLVRRDVQRGVPDRRDPHARDECPPARVPELRVQPRAATHSRDRTRRRRLDDVFRDRTDPRHQREDLGVVSYRAPPDLSLGVVARPVDDLQGVPQGSAADGRGRGRGAEPAPIGTGSPVTDRRRDDGGCSVTATEARPTRIPPRGVIRVAWALHRALLRLRGGRVGLRAPGDKFGLLRLTTVGRRSGQPRVAVVGYYEDGPNLVTVAIKGRGETAPAWWLNLQAHPDTVAALDDDVRYVRGRAAEGDERDRLWARWVEFSEQHDRPAALRSGRTAIVVLEPRTGAEVTA